MVVVLLIFYGIFLSFEAHALTPILKNGTFEEPFVSTVNNSVEYIIEFTGEMRCMPPTVKIQSDNVNYSAPLMVVTRQPKQVLSWQLPLMVDTEIGNNYFNETSRILCYDLIARLGKTSSKSVIYENPIVSISTASESNVSFNVTVSCTPDFYVDSDRYYNVTVTPSKPVYFFYNFSSNKRDSGKNFDTVVLQIESADSVCMVVSIQNASCPVLDLNHEITYSGFYETVSTKGGITIPKDKFPFGFFIVFVAKGSDFDCTGATSITNHQTKILSFIIKPSISYKDYVNAVIITLCAIFGFYVVFGVSFFFCSRHSYRPREMAFVEDSGTVTTPNTPTGDLLDTGSFDETEYDTIAEIDFDKEIFLSKPVIYLSDLARKDPRVLQRKSYLYLYNVLTVAVFYGLPVVQLVITYQKVLNQTGQQDLCYYNFLCAHPLGFLSDFNHLFSNIGYILLGILFLWITHRRERMHQDLNFDRQYGIPQHYGMFYAMGVALIMEGVLSGSYHICPNHTNFQFDSSFMYVVAVLCMVKLYQNRHPDINATAYATFGVLALAILLGMVGILEPNTIFLSIFTVLHIVTCLYLTAQIYYMGCFRLNKAWFARGYRVLVYEFWSGPLNVLKPKYKGRMVLLTIANICNWGLAVFGFYRGHHDFAMFLLMIFMANTMLYFIFYITMKLVHRERLNVLTLVFLLFSTLCAISAMYFFLHKSISWALSPAQSRQFNQDCALLQFYDYHDIWHFLSAIGMFFTFMVLLTLDDDLSHTHRGSIYVF